GFASAHLEVYEVKLIAEVRMGVVKILTYASQGLIECEPSLDANHGEVECIGQANANAALTILNHPLQNETRQEEAQSCNAHHKEEIVEAGEKGDPNKADCRHQNASAKVIVDVDGIAEPGLNQPTTRARNV